jgi:hypothetical protein
MELVANFVREQEMMFPSRGSAGHVLIDWSHQILRHPDSLCQTLPQLKAGQRVARTYMINAVRAGVLEQVQHDFAEGSGIDRISGFPGGERDAVARLPLFKKAVE